MKERSFVKRLMMKLFKVYILQPDEIITWHLIKERMYAGEREWKAEGNPKNGIWKPCWCTPMLNSEKLLLKKIHKHFYGDWYCVDPLGETQIWYIMYDDIKNKVYEVFPTFLARKK